MAGRRRLILADITTSNARGGALKDALGKMNKPAGDYESLIGGGISKKGKDTTSSRKKKHV